MRSSATTMSLMTCSGDIAGILMPVRRDLQSGAAKIEANYRATGSHGLHGDPAAGIMQRRMQKHVAFGDIFRKAVTWKRLYEMTLPATPSSSASCSHRFFSGPLPINQYSLSGNNLWNWAKALMPSSNPFQ